jgi:hypothetical protein
MHLLISHSSNSSLFASACAVYSFQLSINDGFFEFLVTPFILERCRYTAESEGGPCQTASVEEPGKHGWGIAASYVLKSNQQKFIRRMTVRRRAHANHLQFSKGHTDRPPHRHMRLLSTIGDFVEYDRHWEGARGFAEAEGEGTS